MYVVIGAADFRSPERRCTRRGGFVELYSRFMACMQSAAIVSLCWSCVRPDYVRCLNQRADKTPTSLLDVVMSTIPVLDAGGSVAFVATIFADNYFERYVNGKLLVVDRIPFTPFNVNVIRFKATSFWFEKPSVDCMAGRRRSRIHPLCRFKQVARQVPQCAPRALRVSLAEAGQPAIDRTLPACRPCTWTILV